MALHDIAESLIQDAGFQQQLTCLSVGSAQRQFPAICSSDGERLPPFNWSMFLLSASVLQGGRTEQCQAAALRIATHCLTDTTVESDYRMAALQLLDRQANKPAIDLAESRHNLAVNNPDKSAFAYLESVQNRLRSVVRLADGSELRLNRFQQEFWQSAEEAQWVSISAPTSAGKSFVVLQWLGNLLRRGDFRDAIYLVPTRALISQVERDLQKFSETHNLELNVSSIPRKVSLKEGRNVLVFTQERLHLFLCDTATVPKSIGAVVIDEAQKIGDRHRGVLLQDVLERVAVAGRRVIFLSPMTGNPEELLRDRPDDAVEKAVRTEEVLVNQNLLWGSQVPRKPKEWHVQLCLPESQADLGTITLANKPTPESKRLPFVALAMSHPSGNLIYVNVPSDAEKAAMQLHDCLEDVSDEKIDELIDLVKHAIHPQFQLISALRRGIAFHYGNMPLLVKTSVEELFSSGVVRFLVCTSTLVEDVNMSCKNIFVRGPKKGRSTLMQAEDFWNLAGRAGRSGKEFSGNIICVDANKEKLWTGGKPPKRRTKSTIARSADRVLSEPTELIKYMKDGCKRSEASSRPDLEFVVSYLFTSRDRYGDLKLAPLARNLKTERVQELEEQMMELESGIEISPEIRERNLGISPVALQSLLEHFRRRIEGGKTYDDLIPAQPGSDDIVENYARCFASICDHINVKLGPKGGRGYMLALLVSKWLSGYPLSRLIDDRLKRWRKLAEGPEEKRPKKIPNTAAVIRAVMDDVEQIARFEAPRAMAAYIDVLRFFLLQNGQADKVSELEDIGIFLELGVSQETQISLISLGLSRATAIAISEMIENDSLSDEGCLEWLRSNPWDDFDLPELMKREITSVVAVGTEHHD